MYTLQKPWQPGFLEKKQATAHLLVHVCAWQPRYVPKDDVTAPAQEWTSPPPLTHIQSIWRQEMLAWRMPWKSKWVDKVVSLTSGAGRGRCGLALDISLFSSFPTTGSQRLPVVLPQGQTGLSGLIAGSQLLRGPSGSILGTVCTDPSFLGHHYWSRRAESGVVITQCLCVLGQDA